MSANLILPALLAAIAAAIAFWASQSGWMGLGAAGLGAYAGAWLAGDRTSPPVASPSAVPQQGTPAQEPGWLLNALPTGALFVRDDQTIGFANGQVSQIFGIPDLGGQPVAVLRVRRLLDALAEARRTGQAQTTDFTLSRDGEAFFSAHIAPVLEGPSTGTLITIHDQTAGRRAAEVHRDFVANASHELKTPLAAVSGIIETLNGAARDDPAARARFLGMLADQTYRMHRLVADLLSLNRIEINERVAPQTPVALLPVLNEAVEALSPVAAEASVRLVLDCPGPDPSAIADRDEIGQLFRNLIENAIKYGGADVEVRITAGLHDDDMPGLVGVSVGDQGPGIPREDIPRLTERFYRVNVRRSRAVGGTGLGLAICKHILARHRGRLQIESVVGQGSVFTAWLPRTD